MAAANNLLRERESYVKSQRPSPSQPCQAAWDVTPIVFSDTHGRDSDALECMPTTTEGTMPCPTQTSSTPTSSGARPPTAQSSGQADSAVLFRTGTPPSMRRSSSSRHTATAAGPTRRSATRCRQRLWRLSSNARCPSPKSFPWPPDSSSSRVQNLDTGHTPLDSASGNTIPG